MTAAPPSWRRFTLSDGSWGFVDENGRPVITVVALGGGRIEIDCADEVLAWVRQRLPRPDGVIARPGGSRLVYRRHIA